MRTRALADRSWLSSKYATSPLLACAIVFNYVTTGFLVPDRGLIFGFEPHVFDLWSSALVGLSVCGFGWLLSKFTLGSALRNFLSWILGVLVGTVLQGPVLIAFHQERFLSEWFGLIPAAVVSAVAICYVYTLFLSAFVEGVQRTRMLRSAMRNLVAVREKVAMQMEDLASGLRQPVQDKLEGLVNDLRSMLRGGASAEKAADKVFDFITEELRPSAAMIASSIESPSFTKLSQRTKQLYSKNLKKLSFKQSLGVVGGSLVTAVLFVPPFFLLYDGLSALSLALALVVAALVWFGVSKLVGNRLSSWLTWSVLNALIFGVCTLTAELLAVAFGAAVGFDFVLPTAVVIALSTFGFSAAESLIVRRTKLQGELLALNEELESSLIALEARLELVRHNVSRQLHNTVQAELLAIALRLKATPVLNASAVESFVNDLEAVLLAGEASSGQPHSFAERAKDLSDFWKGALEIDWRVTDQVFTDLDLDTNLANRVFVVLREAFTNAAKYSLNGEVIVTLKFVEQSLNLRVENVANQTMGAARPTGIGSRSINDSTSHATFGFDGERYVLEATF